jgi:hypothetical protein
MQKECIKPPNLYSWEFDTWSLKCVMAGSRILLLQGVTAGSQ